MKTVSLALSLSFFLLYAATPSIRVLGNETGTAKMKRRRYAIIIGIGDYPTYSKLEKLYADNDANKLKATLSSYGWTVYLINATAPDRQQPNRANILRALGIEESSTGAPVYRGSDVSFLGSGALTSNDALLFYYGGHGLTADDSVNYIIPRDAVPDEAGVYSKKSLLSIPVIETALRRTGAGNIIMITDACRNVVPTRATGGPPKWRGVTGTEPDGKVFVQGDNAARYFIQRSAGPDQFSYELPEESSGVFSYYLNLALSTEIREVDGNHDGCLSLKELSDYTRSRTVNYVQGKLQKVQQPYVLTDGTRWDESFCIASYTNTTLTTESKYRERCIKEKAAECFDYAKELAIGCNVVVGPRYEACMNRSKCWRER